MEQQATQLRAQAKQLERDAQESFDRCDTDGFLSQWASQTQARKKRMQVSLAEAGGMAEFPCLWDIEKDQRVQARKVDGKYGPVWLLSDAAEAEYGRRFIPTDDSHYTRDEWTSLYSDWDPKPRKSRSSVQRDLDLEQRFILLPAYVETTGSGRGLSGAASVGYRLAPKPEDW